ncbi:hypothetical protein [uncultured Tateyamaria sp.]|uniref:hypothetical protein n=1 Tax=uncultured Tateyamaria sp. TaxID=455651 RepID=UPI002622DD0C|nr:hypothetical protein [uncultured Tateyamaria sp.]
MMPRSLICLGIFVAMIGGESTSARSVDRPAVRVQCVSVNGSDRDMRPLCQQMVQSLAQIIPQAAFRQVSQAQWHPHGSRDISVRLEMSAESGKLLWQMGPMGELHTGPDHPFHANSSAHASDLRQFTDDLVASTQPMLAATALK